MNPPTLRTTAAHENSPRGSAGCPQPAARSAVNQYLLEVLPATTILECGDWSPLSHPATRRLVRRDKSRRAKAPTSRRAPYRFGYGFAAVGTPRPTDFRGNQNPGTARTPSARRWPSWWLAVFAALQLLALPAAAAGASASNAVPLQVQVDPRVELISLIFRLAGNPEYTRGRVPAYLRDLDSHFGDARNHGVVALARRLRANRGVSYDAPMSLAVHLQDAERLELRAPLDPWPEGIDQRWRAADLREFLDQARAFIRETKYGEFRQAHQALYAQTAERARKRVLEEGHLEWFHQFFGERPGARFYLVPALVNGGNCYGPRVKLGAEEEFYCILGVWQCDADGQPVFPREILDTVAHEFCHSYVNPHIYARAAELRPAGQRLFAQVRERMQRMAYGNWETMLHESVVRAAVVRYLATTQGPAAAANQVNREVAQGFLWMKELAALLADYEAQRTQFPRFEAFMPRIVAFFQRLAENRAGPDGGSKTTN
jgi:hypothetical protein